MTLISEIQAVMDIYLDAYRRKDSAGCAGVYLADGALYSPFGPPAIGQDALCATHEAWFAEDEENKTLTVLEARSDGALAYCLAAYSADVRMADGRTQRDGGTNLSVLVRQDGGGWRIKCSSLTPNVD